MFRHAIELDPGFVLAHAGLARALTIAVVMGLTDSRGEALREAAVAARRAIELDPRDTMAHAVLGRVYAAMGEFDAAIAETRTATQLSPNEAVAHYYLGWALGFGGYPQDAMMSIENALRLNPRGPDAFAYLTVGSGMSTALGKFEQAVDWARRALRHPSGSLNFWTYANLAAALGHLDRKDEAQAAIDELLRLRPDFSPEFIDRTLAWQDDESKSRYLDGLRKAGLPK